MAHIATRASSDLSDEEAVGLSSGNGPGYQVAMKFLTAVFCYNEGEKIRKVLDKFGSNRDYDVVLIDDGSDDDSPQIISQYPFPVLRHGTNAGVGEGLRTLFAYACKQGYDAVVIMAGNGKMDVDHVPRLIAPIRDSGFDYVQGSRYLKGGKSANMPRYRTLMIKAFTTIVNLFMGIKGSDVTCGFRAYRTDILTRAEININQDWLGRYEMEYYIHYKVLKAGLKFIEVPVSMIYPSGGQEYSKIKMGSGWWSMIRPWIFLILRLKK